MDCHQEEVSTLELKSLFGLNLRTKKNETVFHKLARNTNFLQSASWLDAFRILTKRLPAEIINLKVFKASGPSDPGRLRTGTSKGAWLI